MERLELILNYLKLQSDKRLCEGISACKSETNSKEEYAKICIKEAGGDVKDYKLVRAVSAEISDRLVAIYERYGYF